MADLRGRCPPRAPAGAWGTRLSSGGDASEKLREDRRLRADGQIARAHGSCARGGPHARGFDQRANPERRPGGRRGCRDGPTLPVRRFLESRPQPTRTDEATRTGATDIHGAEPFDEAHSRRAGAPATLPRCRRSSSAMVLASALLHASWSAVIKGTRSPLAFNVTQVYGLLVVSLAALPFWEPAELDARNLANRGVYGGGARRLLLVPGAGVRQRRADARLSHRALDARLPAVRRGAPARRSAHPARHHRHRRGRRRDLARARWRGRAARRVPIARHRLRMAHAGFDGGLFALRQGRHGRARRRAPGRAPCPARWRGSRW